MVLVWIGSRARHRGGLFRNQRVEKACAMPSVEDPTAASPGVCFERSRSSSPQRLRTSAGERVHRRRERRSWLPEAELLEIRGRRQFRICRPPSENHWPSVRQQRAHVEPRHAFTGPRAQPSAASPRAIARSRRRDSQPWDLRLNGWLRRCFDDLVWFQPRARGWRRDPAAV
jgi:hypothetical protein